MPEAVAREWTSASGRTVEYRAFVPDLLVDRSLSIDDRTLALSERAAIALSAASASSARIEPLARLLLRSEGVASSSIEHVEVPTADLFVAQFGTPTGSAGWILDNIEIIERAAEGSPDLDWSEICRWHADLMEHSRLRPEHIGATRDVQNWIGGPDPSWAVFVPPPPELLDDHIDDLLAFSRRTDLPAIVQAAILHGQFETIHPFADGNGRIGRALLVWCLAHRGVTHQSVPPISPIIAKNTDAYIAGLYDFREESLDRWVAWFADVCIRSAELLGRLASEIDAILEDWKARVGHLRSDAAARRVLTHLAELGALDTDTITTRLEVSRPAARSAMAALEDVGIVHQTVIPTGRPGRPPVAWVAPSIVELITATALRS